MKKEVIYIDVDDDITGIIDRVSTSKDPIAALVLPKRAQVLHSSVNMRLLKRAAEDSKKRLVLITTEAPVLKLAAMVRIHVAKSLTSKPVLAATPEAEAAETILAEGAIEIPPDAKKSIGELAGDKPPIEVIDNNVPVDEEETIELDNLEETEAAPATAVATEKVKKDRKLRVPNFDKFRTRLFLGVAILLIILVGGFFALFVLPKATITVKTQTSDLDTKFDFTANVAATALDEATKVLPAQQKELKQTITEKFTATGSVDKGTKAQGFVTLFNCNKDDETIKINEGSRLIVGDIVFTTDDPVTVPASNFTGTGACKKDQSKDVDVTAALAGDKYNLSARNGYYSPDFTDITGTGSNMTGGTSNVVKVVSAEDVEAVKQKILLRSSDSDKTQLAALLKAIGQFPLLETFTSSPEAPVSNPAVGADATEGTVTLAINYRMLGVAQKDFDQLLAKDQESKINHDTQKIYSNGLDKSKIGLLERKSPGEVKMNISATGTAGPILDATSIAREVAGKTGGETKKILLARPGISSVDVVYEPFWVLKTPKKISRITIKFDGQN